MIGRHLQITSREQDVLRELIRDGADNETIARRTRMAYYTTKHHMKNLLQRAGVPTRAALAVGVLRGDLVPFLLIQDRTGEWLKVKADVGMPSES